MIDVKTPCKSVDQVFRDVLIVSCHLQVVVQSVWLDGCGDCCLIISCF